MMLKSVKIRCQSSLEIEILLMIFRIIFLQKIREKENEYLHNATEKYKKSADVVTSCHRWTVSVSSTHFWTEASVEKCVEKLQTILLSSV